MKTAKHILTAVLFGLCLNLPATTRASDSLSDPSTVQPLNPSFQVAMYRVINSLNMNLRIEKMGEDKLTIKILDERGKVLYEELMGKKRYTYARVLNFSELGDGEYSIVVSNGKEEIVKELSLSTKALYEMPKRLLIAGN